MTLFQFLSTKVVVFQDPNLSIIYTENVALIAFLDKTLDFGLSPPWAWPRILEPYLCIFSYVGKKGTFPFFFFFFVTESSWWFSLFSCSLMSSQNMKDKAGLTFTREAIFLLEHSSRRKKEDLFFMVFCWHFLLMVYGLMTLSNSRRIAQRRERLHLLACTSFASQFIG